MFDPLKEVPSLELCKKLKELDYSQDGGGWYWIKEKDGWKLEYHPKPFSYCPYLTVEDWCGYELDFDKDGFATGKAKYCKFGNKFKECPIFQENVIKAPTARELGEWLPPNVEKAYLINYYLEIEKTNEKWFCKYSRLSYDEPTDLISFSDVSLSNALTKMLVWLVENGYVSLRKES